MAKGSPACATKVETDMSTNTAVKAGNQSVRSQTTRAVVEDTPI